MANESILIPGAELTLETTGDALALANGDYEECTSDNRQPTDNAGYTLGIFEFDTAAGGFTADLTAGAIINIYEQKINSDGSDAPDVSAGNPNDYIGSFTPETGAGSDIQQKLSTICPIHRYGGKYWLLWEDGGAGTAGIDLGWTLRLFPAAYGTAT